jgi:hypothetical protein
MAIVLADFTDGDIDRLVGWIASPEVLRQWAGSAFAGCVVLANGDSVPVDAALPELVFSGSSFDLVLRAAPLAAGWEADIPAFLPSTRTVVPLRARVAGSELIGGRRCWRVEADFAGSAVTFWVAEETRALCQQVLHIRPGVQIMFGAFTGEQEQQAERRSA